DTLWRTGSDSSRQEVVQLRPDDYARMIAYFSAGRETDWARRRAQLAEMLAPEVRVFHIHAPTGLAMEVYNREEFIDRLTLPSRDLRDLQVLSTTYTGDRISELHIATPHSADP
ncbi:MAG: hypothetical protein D6722_14220, partial [Bacteroidetes bacterium]